MFHFQAASEDSSGGIANPPPEGLNLDIQCRVDSFVAAGCLSFITLAEWPNCGKDTFSTFRRGDGCGKPLSQPFSFGETIRLGSARDRTGARDRHATLHDYLRRWEASGLNWPPEASTSAADLERKLFAGPKPSKQPGRPLPDFTRVQAELRANKHVSLQLLWEEYRDANPSAPYSYASF